MMIDPYRFASSGGGGAFSPSDIAGLAQWMKSDAITGLSNGDPIATWSDQSGNGVDFTQPTATNQPEYVTNVINGLPVVRSNADDNVMTSSLPMSATDNVTLFALWSNRATGRDEECPYIVGDGGNGYGLAVSTPFNRKKGMLLGGIAWVDGSPTEESGFEVYVLRRSSGTWKMWVDGGASILTSTSNPSTPATEARLLYHGGPAVCDIDVVEVGCYSTDLTDAQVDDLGGYLADRAGLTWTAIS